MVKNVCFELYENIFKLRLDRTSDYSNKLHWSLRLRANENQICEEEVGENQIRAGQVRTDQVGENQIRVE